MNREIKGELVQRWLKAEPSDHALLVGCEFDDGQREDLLTIVDVAPNLALICNGAAGVVRVPFGLIKAGLLLAPDDSLLHAAIEALVAPHERREAEMRRDLGPGYPFSLSSSDIPALHAAEMARRQDRLPDKFAREQQFFALKRNDLHHQAVEIAKTWRRLALSADQPWGDIAVALTTHLRATGHPTAAIQAVHQALEDRALRATQHEKAKLWTVEAASWLDKYARKGGEASDLAKARQVAARVWAIEAERDHVEISNVYGRLKALETDPLRR
jgi:hypothetical protein